MFSSPHLSFEPSSFFKKIPGVKETLCSTHLIDQAVGYLRTFFASYKVNLIRGRGYFCIIKDMFRNMLSGHGAKLL